MFLLYTILLIVFHVRKFWVLQSILNTLCSITENKWKNIFIPVLRFLAHFIKFKKCLSVWFVCLSIFVHTSFCKYFSNVSKSIYVIQVYHRKYPIKNGLHRTDISHKNFNTMGKNFKNYILTYSYRTFEINMSHSDVQKYFSIKKWHW